MQASSKKRKIWFDNFKYHHISISISFMTSFSYMRWHSTFVISDNWQWEKKFSNSLLGLFKRYCWLMRHFLYLGVEKQTFSGSHSGLFKRYFWLLSHLRWLTVEKKDVYTVIQTCSSVITDWSAAFASLAETTTESAKDAVLQVRMTQLCNSVSSRPLSSIEVATLM